MGERFSVCPWIAALVLVWGCGGDRLSPDVAMDLSEPPADHHLHDAGPNPSPSTMDATIDSSPAPTADAGDPDDAAVSSTDSGSVNDAAPDGAMPMDAVVPPDGGDASDAAPPIPRDMGPGAPADGGAPTRAIFTGPTSDPRTLAGVVIAGDQISFYGCGVGETLATHTWWLFGEVGPDGAVDLSDDAEFSLQGRVVEGRFRGTYQTPEGGVPLELDLPLAAPGARSEMYRLIDGNCLMGVIVVENQEETPQIQGAWCDGEGLFLQVTPVLPFAPDERGLEVSVELPEGPRRFFVTPVLQE